MALRKKSTSSLPTWVFEAIDPKGKLQKGKVIAETQADAIAALEVDNLIPVSVELKGASAGQIEVFGSRPLKLKIGDRATFARQLYMLVRSGLQLTKALSVLAEDNDDASYSEMVNSLAEDVLSGVKFSVALGKFPRCFDSVFVSYIKAGEETGDMQGALQMLARQLDQQRGLILKVKAVTAYPRMMGAAIILITIAILKFLVPVFEGIYAEFGTTLPLPTRIILAVSRNMMIPLFLISASIGGSVFYLKKNKENLELRTKVEKVKYRIPVLGPLAKDVMLHRWSTTLAGALKSGLQSMPALAIAAGASGSFWVRLVSRDLIEGLRLGRPLSDEIRKYPDLFDARTRAMASSGEEAGEIAEMFDALGETIESEINAQIATLGARLEVGLLLLMGAVVGVLLIALYMPIFGLADAVGSGYGE